ncbi:MAG TPA: hypothetical protein VGH77_07405 [Streptosporangiaceae bacterium]|jgi:hypothetical protein
MTSSSSHLTPLAEQQQEARDGAGGERQDRVSQPVSGVRRFWPSASTRKNSAHSTAHCSHSTPIVGALNLTMLVMPNAVAMIATQAEYQPSPVARYRSTAGGAGPPRTMRPKMVLTRIRLLRDLPRSAGGSGTLSAMPPAVL